MYTPPTLLVVAHPLHGKPGAAFMLAQVILKAVKTVRYVRVRGRVANPRERSRSETVEFLADAGSIYTMIPESILNRLGIQKTAVRRFKIASGEIKEYPVGEAYVEIEGQGATSLVVFGPVEATTLLGVTTLELLGLQVDPITGTLKPLELLLLSYA